MSTSPSPSLAERLARQNPRLGLDDRCAAEIMTAGVVALPVTASLDNAAEAMAAHDVHGILAVSCDGQPIGWMTADRLLTRLDHSRTLDWAVDAVGEDFVAVTPTAPMADVVEKLNNPSVTRVAVQTRPGLLPEGVITKLDIASFVGSPPRHPAL
jgi:CBS domain-containing protein